MLQIVRMTSNSKKKRRKYERVILSLPSFNPFSFHVRPLSISRTRLSRSLKQANTERTQLEPATSSYVLMCNVSLQTLVSRNYNLKYTTDYKL